MSVYDKIVLPAFEFDWRFVVSIVLYLSYAGLCYLTGLVRNMESTKYDTKEHTTDENSIC